MICRQRALPVILAGLMLAACGAGEAGDDGAGRADVESDIVVESTVATTAVDPTVGAAAPEVRRVLPLALRPESEIPNNFLPPIEVHDVGQDRMVNFRNVFPAERPVLLWMWAPY